MTERVELKPWTSEEPTEAGYYLFIGVPFYKPVVARVNAGARSKKLDDGSREYWPELNVQYFAEGYYSHQWHRDGWRKGQWHGPIEIPDGYDEVIHPVVASRMEQEG